MPFSLFFDYFVRHMKGFVGMVCTLKGKCHPLKALHQNGTAAKRKFCGSPVFGTYGVFYL